MRCQYATCVAWREIRWTEDSETHIARHDVTPDEVEQVVNTRPRLVEPGPGDIEEVYGRTDAGRYLVVILSEAEDGRDFVVTARDLTDSERRSFLRRTT
ncbi:hypothetical protein C8E95_6893 [Pseudonocardia autotrophica]|nr:hypothetical protein C8E95_6893 [Pseudonocardia autotrophica]